MNRKESMMKKRIVTLLTALTVLAGSLIGSPAFAAAEFTNKDIQLTVANSHAGDVFYSKNPSFHLTVNNPTNTGMDINLSISAQDEDGSQVWNNNQTITVPARSQKVIGVHPVVEKYGVYDLTVTATGNFGTISRNGSFTCVKENTMLNDFMGTQTHFVWGTRDTPDKNLPLIKDSGFGMVRDHIEWYQVDVNAEDGIPATTMEYVDKVYESGQKLIMIIGNSNPAYDNGGLPVSSDALTAFSEFCTYVATKLKGKVYAYEIWNEPDYFDAFTNGIESTGAQYANLLKTAYQAIDPIDPEALILGGSLTGIAYKNEWTQTGNTAMEYMKGMLSAGAANYMDGFAFHPYANTGYLFTENTVARREPGNQISLARSILDDYGATNMPIWITEIGTSSYVDDNSDEDDTDEGYTEHEQAINFARIQMITRAEPTVAAVSFYNHREKGNNPNDSENNFGILNGDYTGKPAYVTISFLNDFLLDAEAVSNTKSGTLVQYRMKDKCDESDKLGFWTTGGGNNTLTLVRGEVEETTISGKTLTYPMSHTVKVYDMYGNAISGSSITVGAEPVFVECVNSNATPKITVENGHVTVTGKIRDESGAATVLVYKNVLGSRDLVYAEQVNPTHSYGYTVEFEIADEELYGVCIYDGKMNTDFVNTSAYDIGIELYKGTEKIEGFDAITNGDTVKAVLKVGDPAGTGKNLSFFGAVYGKDNVLLTASKGDIVWNGSKEEEIESSLTIQDVNAVEGLKFMLWDNELTPILKPMQVK